MTKERLLTTNSAMRVYSVEEKKSTICIQPLKSLGLVRKTNFKLIRSDSRDLFNVTNDFYFK